jgi:hypothetical protein
MHLAAQYRCVPVNSDVRAQKELVRLDPDFTEDVVSIALATYLAVLTYPRMRFSIEPFSRSRERWLGADARLTDGIVGIRPFYMQFKRPHGYLDTSKARVVKDRKKLVPPLNVTPRTLYFSLREKQVNHSDYQHNILYRLSRRLQKLGLGEAAYVCPLFLSRQAYIHGAHLAALRRGAGYWRRPYDLQDLFVAVNGTVQTFQGVPVLAEHVVIRPHDKVTTAKHSYSFSEDGREVCFHSPLSLPEGSEQLGWWLSQQAKKLLSRDSLVTRDGASQKLMALISADVEDAIDSGFRFSQPAGTDGFGGWLEWGEYLHREYSIEQYACVLFEP